MAAPSPYFIDAAGRLRFKAHPGQIRALECPKRFILVTAGTQGGKTSFGPWWLLREIRRCGAGDYLAVSPTFPLLLKKMLPEFLKLFQHRLGLGTYVGGTAKTFTFSPEGAARFFGYMPEEPTQIFFGHAQDPESLESATALAAWLDEAGQKKYKLGTWEAIQRRLSLAQGRCLFTTTPYYLGWLKKEVYDPGLRGDPDCAVINFASNMNPAFPQAEFERMKSKLPRWKFNMMYRGLFERPAGMIYDVFRPAVHTTPRFDIPDDWPRFWGADFGGVNTVFLKAAREPFGKDAKTGKQTGGRFYVYEIYHEGGRTAKEHAQAVMQGEPRRPYVAGGAPSEDQWRNEFRAAGLVIHRPPVADVEVGIDRVYSLLKGEGAGEDEATGEAIITDPGLVVFDDLTGLIDEFEAYSRVLDEEGEPTPDIEDKSDYHRLDALRYMAAATKGMRRTTGGILPI